MNPPNPQDTLNTQDPTVPPFRVSAKKIFVTIPTHFSVEYINFINEIKPIKNWILGREKADEHDPYEHTHLAIEFVKRPDWKNCRVIDFNDQHPNIQPVKNWANCVKYCMKENDFESNFDTKDYKDFKGTVKAITECETALIAVSTCAKKLQDVSAVIQVHNLTGFSYDPELLAELENAELRPWQQKVYDILLTVPDRRSVHWVTEPIGETGKSYLCDIIEARHNMECCVIAHIARCSDIFDVFRRWKHMRDWPKMILFDIPRKFEDGEAIYPIIESFKNGRVTCTKYEGRTLRFKPPHVVVFSNWFPDLKQLSRDRWHIWSIEFDDIIPVTLWD